MAILTVLATPAAGLLRPPVAPSARTGVPSAGPPLVPKALLAGRGRTRQATSRRGPAAGATRTPDFIIEQVRRGATVPLLDRPGGRVIARVGATTAYGSAQTLSVEAHAGKWLGVTSADLPSGRLGWIDRGASTLETRSTHISLRVYLSRRQLELLDGGRVVRRATVGIGSAGFPTPPGRLAVTDKLRGAAYAPGYGCCILALSGRQSHTPPGWPGGDRLAIHGTNDPGYIGTSSSAGCLIADARELILLMQRVPLGAPVSIQR